MTQTNRGFSISALANETGVKASALRYYESIGLLDAPRRVNGQRRYTADAFETVRFIQAAQAVGFTLDEIKSIRESQSTNQGCCTPYLLELAHKKIREMDALIERASAMKKILVAGLSCQCSTLNDCLLFISTEKRGAN